VKDLEATSAKESVQSLVHKTNFDAFLHSTANAIYATVLPFVPAAVLFAPEGIARALELRFWAPASSGIFLPWHALKRRISGLPYLHSTGERLR